MNRRDVRRDGAEASALGRNYEDVLPQSPTCSTLGGIMRIQLGGLSYDTT